MTTRTPKIMLYYMQNAHKGGFSKNLTWKDCCAAAETSLTGSNWDTHHAPITERK